MTSAVQTAPSGLLVDPSRPVRFFFEGRPIDAFAGQSFGAALYQAGVRIFSRSFKYHRPRGLFCVTGRCPNCMMQVDGTPNVRVCVEPVRDGGVVQAQNTWPDRQLDLLSVFDRLDRFLPVGFYYKRMYRPRWLWPVYEHVLRHVAGLGHVDPAHPPAEGWETQHLHADLTVVGAGPAGLAAALEAAQAGARVILLDREARPGGHLLYEPFHGLQREEPSASASGHDPSPGANGKTALELADELAEPVRASDRIEYFPQSTAFGVYEGLLVGAMQEKTFLRIRTRHLLVATGANERPLIFHNNDLPGVFLGRGVERLRHLYGVDAGGGVLVVTDGAAGYALAADLLAQATAVAGIVDLRPGIQPDAARASLGQAAGDEYALANLPLFAGHAITAGLGGRHVRGALLTEVDSDGKPLAGRTKRVACDLICQSIRRLPANELLYQARCRMCYDPQTGCYVPSELPRGVSAAGEVCGTHDLAAILSEGRLRGTEAAVSLGFGGAALHERCRDLHRRSDEHRRSRLPASGEGPRPGFPSLMPALSPRHRKRFVCLCEDVTEKDLCQAIDEGFDNIETLKRYSTVCMGPCQGKVCSMASVEICARQTRQSAAEVGTTTSRPPAEPVPLGMLARKHPGLVKQTPMADRHDQLGARWIDAGAWKRPESYGDPEAEYRAVRQAAGLIDVSTLGKIELFGTQVPELLDRVYLNNWAKLRVGRVRYGVMCNEEGIILDDGTCGRLADHHFFMTTTTGNAAYLFSWLQWWREVWGLEVQLVDATSAFAAISLAGPQARAVLSRLTDADLSAQAVPYMSLITPMVAGVATRILRIGFVGELGYEIHVPSHYGAYVWDTILEAGRDLGIRPVGVEAQRRLRLDKAHIIIGQDTDALSDPLAAGMDWIVKLEKPFFLGGPSLQRRARGTPAERLIGFTIDDAPLVPPEGSMIVQDGAPAGRVTSTRYSQTLQRVIGLGWVKESLSRPGQQLTVRLGAEQHHAADGIEVSARVVPGPFYDPDGARLRS